MIALRNLFFKNSYRMIKKYIWKKVEEQIASEILLFNSIIILKRYKLKIKIKTILLMLIDYHPISHKILLKNYNKIIK
jgi:hypothetical protein